MGRNSRSRDFIKWPPEVQQHADALFAWALEHSQGDMTTSPLTAAINLITCNLREAVIVGAEAKPDGRVVKYGVRLAAVHPQTGDYLAFYPWQHNIAGMENVWRFVSENGWQLYDGMEAMPVELTLPDLVERTNTARVAMSRRADGVAVIRVRFQWQKKREKRNFRRGADPDDVKVFWHTEEGQLNVWIAPEEEAKAMEAREIAARHPLSGLLQA